MQGRKKENDLMIEGGIHTKILTWTLLDFKIHCYAVEIHPVSDQLYTLPKNSWHGRKFILRSYKMFVATISVILRIDPMNIPSVSSTLLSSGLIKVLSCLSYQSSSISSTSNLLALLANWAYGKSLAILIIVVWFSRDYV